jgi:hypothetical protein
VFGNRFTRNGTVLVAFRPGVVRRFPDEATAERIIARYVAMGGPS